jgi:hypothetical protein
MLNFLVAFYETEWFGIIMTAIAMGIAGLITWCFAALQAWLKTKVKNEKLQKVLSAVLDAIRAAVLSVQQTFVAQLKKDGKFDAEKQKEALHMALDSSMKMLSDEAKVILKETFGDVELWMTTQIEALVLTRKETK